MRKGLFKRHGEENNADALKQEPGNALKPIRDTEITRADEQKKTIKGGAPLGYGTHGTFHILTDPLET